MRAVTAHRKLSLYLQLPRYFITVQCCQRCQPSFFGGVGLVLDSCKNNGLFWEITILAVLNKYFVLHAACFKILLPFSQPTPFPLVKNHSAFKLCKCCFISVSNFIWFRMKGGWRMFRKIHDHRRQVASPMQSLLLQTCSVREQQLNQ